MERERRGISVTLLPKFLCPDSCPFYAKKSNCGNAITEIGKKRKFFFGNCGNGIAENGKKKLNGIMAMSLPKMGGKKKFVAKI